jgi:hypothetical protein
MRKKRKHYHGWKDGDAYFLSIYPRKDNEPANQYASAQDALREVFEQLHEMLTAPAPVAKGKKGKKGGNSSKLKKTIKRGGKSTARKTKKTKKTKKIYRRHK